MIARPGRLQSGFTAGELDPLLAERTELKYFSAGADHAENVVIIPQGGFRNRDGLRDLGAVNAAASRIFPFAASDGSAYDLVFSPGSCQVWGASAELATFSVSGLTAGMLSELTEAQQLDTMLLFHPDLRSKRIKHSGPTSWAVDNLPYEQIPNYDYGEVYTNGEPAVWQLEFVGLNETPPSVFTITVSQQETVSIEYNPDMLLLAASIETAILDLPNVSPGIVVVSASGSASGKKVNITFSGVGNEGDGWAVSGRVINKADAAILAFKTTPGVAPGEPVISAARGWPACGAFYGQRLMVGGFKGLPNAWMFSRVGFYYSFDERFTEANGPAMVPMDVAGGERIVRIVPNRNLLIFTTQAEYWISERTISRTQAPNHVQASRNGARPGVPIVDNEGAALYVHSDGNVLAEFRYTDVEGNFVSSGLSVLAPHLMTEARDLATRKATGSTSGNLVGLVTDGGDARLVGMLREQEVTGFTRMTSPDATFHAVAVNARNEMSMLVQRPAGRRFERLEEGLLLDSAVSFTYGTPQATITGLGRFAGLSVWAIGDGHVFGPFTVFAASVTLPIAVNEVTVGTWSPPKVRTLPPPRTIGPNMVLKRRARIHSVQLSVLDTTSIAIAVNDGPLRDIDLVRFGAPADVPELEAPYSGTLTIRGLTGFSHEPTVTISQVRPGRMTVRSVTIEAAL